MLSAGGAYAPTLVVSRRIHMQRSSSLDDILADDLAALEKTCKDFVLREQARLTIGRADARSVEYDFTDARGERVRQRMILRWVGDQLYSVTATHLAKEKERFASVAAALTTVVEGLRPLS